MSKSARLKRVWFASFSDSKKLMRTAVYIEEGVLQVVLTPETTFEKSIVKDFALYAAQNQVTILPFVGAFYDCNGGWIRQASGDSLMLRLDKITPTAPEVKQ